MHSIDNAQDMRKHLLHCIDLLKNHNFDDYISQRLCATIRSDYGNHELISIGFNRSYSGHFCENLNKYRIIDYCPSIHAEADAIIKARMNNLKYQLNDATLYIARMKNNGNIGCAKPCNFCLKFIIKHKLKKVCFTIDNNSFGILPINTEIEDIIQQYFETISSDYMTQEYDAKLEYLMNDYTRVRSL